MFTQIKKRDDRIVPFNEAKITDAIFAAAKAVGGEDRQTAMELTLDVLKYLKQQFNGNIFSVEDVQDAVEKVLIEKGHAKTAKAYILYREKRSRIREARSEMMDAVAEILRETNRENANVGNSPSAKVLQISEVASVNYYLKRVIPEDEAKAHIEGDIYIHDLSWYGKTLTCLQIPLDRLLREGFNNGHGYIRPPKGIKTAAALAAIILQSNQNDMHGGQSFAYFDRDMAPYVELEYQRQEKSLREALEKMGTPADEDKIKELAVERTENEVYQAMEGFIYNLNTMHSRAGAQVPFSSINLGTDTSWAGRMITKNFLLAYEKGLGKGEAPIFPNVCFKIKEGVNYEEDDPNYDLFKLSMKVACTRLFPNFSFQDSSFNAPYRDEEVAYMGCRTRVIGNVNGPAVTNGRGNLSFTTVNLPRLGIKSGGDMTTFWQSLDEILNLAFKQLMTRYDIQKKLRVKDFPFLMGQKLYLDSEDLKPNDPIEKAIRHGTLSLGFIGLAECLIALTGKHHGESQEAQALGLSIVSYLRRRCDEASKKFKLNFTLLATPAEGLSGKFTKKDRERFGIIPRITDKEWYTNSFHIPVDFEITAMEKIALEGPYHKYCNAGHISYVELPSAPKHNLQAFEALIRAMYEADMGYAAVNFPVDICKECGFNGVIEIDTCPKCGSQGNISRIRRITGYLSSLEFFNQSKIAEEKNRKVHMKLS
ncbi:MAG: anaerobic ribonucleoside triphosphate reductase [Bacillota bacterium]|uniref:Anaerobic ribonucleoside triphosphate reductase n=1 Tax=Thermanaerosceptrum fracticalcis TaxID=1712410 RepID=A0A7G6DZ56_THEFR|nr:anaerobic ribonucleoside triphosphate reductase [Thermanaerosceptrum fracticalcis]QNB45110.1 anaerobic ribonucleoside triphosphate reductase [Thermanaerosceptrum fracticalcis]